MARPALPAAARAAADGWDVAVVVPTLRPGAALARLIRALREQTRPPAEIIVVDSSSDDGTAERAREMGCRVEVVRRESFDHGGTRNLGAGLAHSPIIVFMTQDAVPANAQFIAQLLRPLHEGCAGAYARQIPHRDASPTERFQRAFNYPPRSHVRSARDLDRLGLKAAFFSNVASAVDRAAYNAVQGFPTRVVFSEDMILAYRLLIAGYQVAYVAEAQVYHSHAYGLREQFRRYFDIGASQMQAEGELGKLPAAREGVRFAREQVKSLARQGAWAWLPRAGVELAAKWIAFQLGRRHRRLPLAVVRRCSLQPAYWGRAAGAARGSGAGQA
jgi:rhamnosyltransferase